MASRRTARTARALWEEVDDLKQRLGSIVTSMEAALAGGGNDAKHVVEDKARTFLELGTELVNSLTDDAVRAAGTVAARSVKTVGEIRDDGIACLEDTVRERPVAAVAIAFGMGWLVARLTARR